MSTNTQIITRLDSHFRNVKSQEMEAMRIAPTGGKDDLHKILIGLLREQMQLVETLKTHFEEAARHG